jgi:hypothetical protein
MPLSSTKVSPSDRLQELEEKDEKDEKQTSIEMTRVDKTREFYLPETRLHEIRKRDRMLKSIADIDEATEHWDRQNFKGSVFGSRAVGGQKPVDTKAYNSIESIDFTIPDTFDMKKEVHHMDKERKVCCCKVDRKGLRLGFLWFVYFVIGVIVSMYISLIIFVEDLILSVRVDATKSSLYGSSCWC